MVDRGDIGTIIDLLTKLSETIVTLTDNIGTMGTIFVATFTSSKLKTLFNNNFDFAKTMPLVSGLGKGISGIKQNGIKGFALSQKNVLDDGKGGYITLTSKDMSALEQYNSALRNTDDVGQLITETFGEGVNPAIKDVATSADGAMLSVKQMTSANLAASKAGLVLKNVLVSLATVAITAFASYAISKGIQWIINKIGEEKKKVEELTEATEKYNSTAKTIDEQIEKYKELNEKLEKNVLTSQEYKDIKEQLTGIQETLIDSYGREASSIDLVNGQYEEQLNLLKEIEQKKAKSYVVQNSDNNISNQQALASAKEKAKTYTVTPGNGILDSFRSVAGQYSKLSNAKNIQDLFAKYGITQKGSSFSFNSDDYDTNVKNLENIIIEIQELYGQGGENDKYAKIAYDMLKRWYDNADVENYDQYVSNDTTFTINKIKSMDWENNENPYDILTKSIEDFNTAVATGKNTESAYKNLENAKKKFLELTEGIVGADTLYNQLIKDISTTGSFKFQWEDILDKFDSENIDSTSESASQSMYDIGLNSVISLLKGMKDGASTGTGGKGIVEWLIDQFNNGNAENVDALEEGINTVQSFIDNIISGKKSDESDGNLFSKLKNKIDDVFSSSWEKTRQQLANMTDEELSAQDPSDPSTLLGSLIKGFGLTIDQADLLINKLKENGLIRDAAAERNKALATDLMLNSYSSDKRYADDRYNISSAGIDMRSILLNSVEELTPEQYAAIANKTFNVDSFILKFMEQLTKMKNNGATSEEMQEFANSFTTKLTNAINTSMVAQTVNSDVWMKYSETVHKMMDLSRVGKLDEDHIKSLEGYQELLSDTGDDVDALIKKIEELQKSSTNPQLDSVSDMATVEGGLGSLNTVYQSKMYDSKHLVSGSDLSGLFDQFGDLPEDELTSFISVMQDMNATAEESQQAFDSLATAYLDAKYPLDDLTEANAEWTAKQLEAEGVTNAGEAVQQRLAAIEKVRTDALNELNAAVEASGGQQSALYQLMQNQGITSTEDLANATASEITALINEANASGYDVTALRQLLAQKKNTQAVNYTGDVNALLNEAKAAGVDSTAYHILDKMKYYGNIADATVKDNLIQQLRNEVQNALNSFTINFTPYSYKPTKTSTTSGGSGGSGGSSDNKTEQQYDWIEVKITRITEAITRLNNIATNTFEAWDKRTESINGELSKTKYKIEVLTKGASAYYAEADKVAKKGLSQDWINKIKNGAYEINTVTDEKLKELIDEYKQWYDKAVETEDQIYETKKSLSELAKTKFDNIATQFNEIVTSIENVNSEIESLKDNLEKQGRTSFATFYKAELEDYEKELQKKTSERSTLYNYLKDSLKNGYITYDTEEYYNMVSTIQQLDNEIIQLNGNIIEMNNNIRQTAWDNFDLARTKVSDVIDEVEFLSKLLGDEKLTDGLLNTGLTKEGNAQMGTFAYEYNLYMKQAQAYAEEIKKIEKEIAKDSANQDLINRKNELVKSQQSAIESAISEKNAMIDLARNGYDAVLSKMQELINAKKEMLTVEQETYEYQKTLAEKNKALASLYKQQAVYANDTSEEGRKRLQELKKSINDAENDLKDTEYNKYISDQQNMMDKMYEDLSDFIDDMFEDTDTLLQTLIDSVNANSKENNATIQQVTKDAGYSIQTSIKDIFSDNIKDVSGIKNGLVETNTSISKIFDAVNKIVETLTNQSEKDSKDALNTIDRLDYNPSTTTSTATTSGGSAATPSGTATSSGSSSSSSGSSSSSSSASSPKFSSMSEYVDSLYLSSKDKNSLLSQLEQYGIYTYDSYTEGMNKVNKLSADQGLYIRTYIAQSMKTLGAWVDGLKLTDKAKEEIKNVFAYGGLDVLTDAGLAYACYVDRKIPNYDKVDDTGKWLLTDYLSYLFAGGLPSYATGTKHHDGIDGLAWTNENGKGEIIRKSDGALLTPVGKGGTVFTNAMSDVLWDFAKNPQKFLDAFSVTSPSVSSANLSQQMQLNIGTINLPNVTKPEEFSNGLISALKNDNNLVSAIQSVTVDRLMGSNKKKINTF